jgi:mannose-6-phosphate isomerase
MARLYPIVFQPRLKQRVWGGRTLASLYGRKLPPDVPIGESWEIADRPGDESVIAAGPLAGRTLRSLMEESRAELLGGASPAAGDRFPLLCKILDARDRLSLQVHPRSTGLGEPKTEMWYVAQAIPGAELHVGLRRGVTRQEFEMKIAEGRVADCFGRIGVRAGDVMFLPSGRVHGIGAGLVIFEIQQNSDTTFRVFDWNRIDLDGRPRELHVAQSLESIDFDDVEPTLVTGRVVEAGALSMRTLVRHSLFDADLVRSAAAGDMPLAAGMPTVIAVAEGRLTVAGGGRSQDLRPGDFCLVPAAIEASIAASPAAAFLLARPH